LIHPGYRLESLEVVTSLVWAATINGPDTKIKTPTSKANGGQPSCFTASSTSTPPRKNLRGLRRISPAF